MLLKIYGKKHCHFCDKAKKLGTQLESFRSDLSVEYIDYEVEEMSKDDVAKIVDNPVETLPQIMLDEEYIGGYNQLEVYVRKNRLFSK